VINKATLAKNLTSIKRYSAKSTHNTTYTWMGSPYTTCQLATQYSATSTHKTPPPLGWGHHTQHVNSQLNTEQPAHTQHHLLRSDGVTIYTAYQVQGKKKVFISLYIAGSPKLIHIWLVWHQNNTRFSTANAFIKTPHPEIEKNKSTYQFNFLKTFIFQCVQYSRHKPKKD
jgi:hypothetical protein